MEDDTICNTIIEGCLPNTPSRIQCEPIELDIPTNVQVLFESDTYHPHKYPLYATTSDFSTYDVVHNPFFEKGSISTPHTSFSGGWLSLIHI